MKLMVQIRKEQASAYDLKLGKNGFIANANQFSFLKLKVST